MAKSIIIYDDACPMCKLYTAGFEKAGWVERTGFSKASETLKAQLDLNRARHEIPLFDPETGKVHYGMDALFRILGERVPLFKPLFFFPPFRWLIYGLYQIITYNRRVIAGSAPPAEGFDCAPDRHVPMRGLYIILSFGVSLWMLSNMPLLSFPLFLFPLIHLLVFIYGFMEKEDVLDFTGHWTTILLATSFILINFQNLSVGLFLSIGLVAFLWWKRAWVL